MLAGASFATELNDPKNFPNQFMAGPDYSEMIGILLEYIAKTKPVRENRSGQLGYRIRTRSDCDRRRSARRHYGLKAWRRSPHRRQAVDVLPTEVLKLRRANPDYTIFHGYMLAPIPEFMSQADSSASRPSSWAHSGRWTTRSGRNRRSRRRLHGRDALSLLFRRRAQRADAGEDPANPARIPVDRLYAGFPYHHADANRRSARWLPARS